VAVLSADLAIPQVFEDTAQVSSMMRLRKKTSGCAISSDLRSCQSHTGR